MEQNWITLLQQENQLAKVMEMNRKTEKFGLVLSEQEETGNELSEYLLQSVKGLAVRLKNAADHGTLCKMI